MEDGRSPSMTKKSPPPLPPPPLPLFLFPLFLFFLLVLSFVVFRSVEAPDATCQFPAYLHRAHLSPSPDSKAADQSIWLTQIKFIPRTRTLESQFEITVRSSSSFVVKHKLEKLCSEEEEEEAAKDPKDNVRRSVLCHQREVLYERTCVKEAGNNKYIVLHTDANNRYPQFVCMKFVFRSANVVQVWQGVRSGALLDECSDSLLRRDEWLWIAPQSSERQFCSLVGGFDFWIINATNNERGCYKDWRSFRLESECVHGEGMAWHFPPSTLCSLFDDNRIDLRLECWVSWTEEGKQFLVAGERGKLPQFVLVFSEQWNATNSFRVQLFFSPRVPLDTSAAAAHHQHQHQHSYDHSLVHLSLSKSESGLCYDESHLCVEYARKEKCNKNGLYLYANKCKKSCGICKLLPTAKPECHFSSDVIGEWVFFESDRKERVTITSGHVTIETLGDFICKSKHWTINYYKTLSYYNNGCRPRYTCLRVEREMEDTLRFQLGHSSLSDNSFDLCIFKDEPPPLGKRIHGSEPKILLPLSKVRSDTCGLRGSVGVVTKKDADDRVCQGTLSDWDEGGEACSPQPRLELTLRGHCSTVVDRQRPKTQRTSPSAPTVRYEFHCIAYVSIAEGFGLLLTRSNYRGAQNRTLCWIIYTYARRPGELLWREAHVLQQTQCGHESDLDPVAVQSSAFLSLTVTNDSVEMPCAVTRATYSLPSTRLTPSKPIDSISHRQRTENIRMTQQNAYDNTPPNLSLCMHRVPILPLSLCFIILMWQLY